MKLLDYDFFPSFFMGITRREMFQISGTAVVTGLTLGGAHFLSPDGKNPEQEKKGKTGPDNSAEQVRMYTEMDVRRHLHHSLKRWTPLEKIIKGGSFNCIDGRGDQCEVGTPGGDLGNLVRMIGAFQTATNTEFSEEEIEQIFDRYRTVHKGDFYLHSDSHAIEHLAEELGIEEEELRSLIDKPGKYEKKLLDAVDQGKLAKCGHVSNMRKKTSMYPGLTPRVVNVCLRKFFKEKWQGNADMDFDILPGEHKEGAVVNIRSKHPLEPNSRIPLVQPRVKIHGTESSVFLLHPDVEAKAEVLWLDEAEQIVGLRQYNRSRCREIMQASGKAYLAATAQALVSPHMKMFDAFYDERQQFEIRQAV